MSSRTPDYILKAMDKATGARTDKIGAAWKNADGTVQLVLDPGTTIEANRNLVLTLFPNDRPVKEPPAVAGIRFGAIDTRKMVK